MQVNRSILILSLIICFVLVLLFFIGEVILSNLTIYLDRQIEIQVTEVPFDWAVNKQSNTAAEQTQTNVPGVLSIGNEVQIGKTDGDGLLIRSEPEFNGTPLYLGAEGEEFTIIGGPQIANSTIWWKIQSAIDGKKMGWAVHDFLIRKIIMQ